MYTYIAASEIYHIPAEPGELHAGTRKYITNSDTFHVVIKFTHNHKLVKAVRLRYICEWKFYLLYTMAIKLSWKLYLF